MKKVNDNILKVKSDEVKDKVFRLSLSDQFTWYGITLSLTLSIIGVIFGFVITDVSALKTKTDESEKKIELLNEEILKLRTQIEATEQRERNFLNQQRIYLDRLSDNLLFIYSRSDLQSTQQWQKSLIEHKDKAEKDLSFDKLPTGE